MKDYNADGMLGNHYYNRGHVTFKRNILGLLVSFIAVVGGLIIGLVILGAILNVNLAQEAVNTVIAGKK